MTRDLAQRRVVITGLGVVAPNGCDLGTFWSSVRTGTSAAGPVTRFDVSELPNKIACEVHDFNPSNYMDNKKSKRFEVSIRYGIAAARMAAADADVNFTKLDPDRAGIIEGSTVGGMESSFKGQTTFEQRGYRHMSPFTLINAYCGGGSGEIALELGIHGHAISISTGSASGNDAVGMALDLIQRDDADIFIAGGAESPILAPLWGAFCLTKVMTTRNEEPKSAMRPFDNSRDGFLLGEGAAFLVLEELGHALGRGAKIYAELVGHGRSCEAYHSVSPHPEGLGLHRAMEKALRRARMDVTQIDYINAHATATEANDVVETKAIKKLFGEHAHRVAVSGTKPVTGHLLGAAGAVESVITALAIHHREIPPTANLTTPAEGCDLDYVPIHPRPYPIRAAMNLNVGFGGKNSCLVFKEYRRA